MPVRPELACEALAVPFCSTSQCHSYSMITMSLQAGASLLTHPQPSLGLSPLRS